MTSEERKLVHEFLEISHGYAIVGSLVPMIAAREDIKEGHGLSTDAAMAVFVKGKEFVTAELVGVAAGKPTTAEYVDAIGRALDKIEALP